MTQEKYKYLAYAYETRMPEVAGKDYPLATLLYTPDAAKTVALSNREIFGGITGLTATTSGADTINLNWTAVSGALGYNIYRSTAADGVFTKMNSAPITGASYSSIGINPNTTYYYQVSVAGGSTSTVVAATTAGSTLALSNASSKNVYDVKVYVNGNAIQSDEPTYIKSDVGLTYVPIRFVSEALGAKVDWIADSQTVIAVGNKTMLVDNKDVEIEAPAEKIGERTFVPVRFISETLGAKVNWIDTTRTVNITMNAS